MGDYHINMCNNNSTHDKKFTQKAQNVGPTFPTTLPSWFSQSKPALRRFTRFSQTGFRIDKSITP